MSVRLDFGNELRVETGVLADWDHDSSRADCDTRWKNSITDEMKICLFDFELNCLQTLKRERKWKWILSYSLSY